MGRRKIRKRWRRNRRGGNERGEGNVTSTDKREEKQEAKEHEQEGLVGENC